MTQKNSPTQFQLHFLVGAGRSAGDYHLRATGLNGLHDRVLADGQHPLPPHRVCKGRLGRRLRVHPDRTFRRTLLCHRESAPQAACEWIGQWCCCAPAPLSHPRIRWHDDIMLASFDLQTKPLTVATAVMIWVLAIICALPVGIRSDEQQIILANNGTITVCSPFGPESDPFTQVFRKWVYAKGTEADCYVSAATGWVLECWIVAVGNLAVKLRWTRAQGRFWLQS